MPEMLNRGSLEHAVRRLEAEVAITEVRKAEYGKDGNLTGYDRMCARHGGLMTALEIITAKSPNDGTEPLEPAKPSVNEGAEK